MDDEDNDYELERQKIIAENRALLDSLGFEEGGSAKLNIAKPKPRPIAKPSSTTSSHKKRKSTPTKSDDGPRRRSGRIAGIEASVEVLQAKAEEEEKEREILRVINRKTRDQVMQVGEMMEEAGEGEKGELNTFLQNLSSHSNPRRYPSESTTSSEAYAHSEPSSHSRDLDRLKSQFKNMHLRANAKVTGDRVFSMVVHPEPTKCVVCVGDKYGQLGIWDALGPSAENVKAEEDDTGAKVNGNGAAEEDEFEGRIWRVQAHARNSITSMKIDPIDGSKLYSSSYDCSLRSLSFSDCISREVFSFADEDMLITHFDLTPDGHQAWIADKNGGISHVDWREARSGGASTRHGTGTGGGGSRRRWVVQEEGRAAKLGGLSVNPLMPHLIVTAGNDQHLRLWDTRHLHSISPRSVDTISPSPSSPLPEEKKSDTAEHISTQPTSNIPSDRIYSHLETPKGKGLLRGSWQHGKSCSAAYWDPWGRRVLTTSYDDKLRVWNLSPQSLEQEKPLDPKLFSPTKSIPHNCQTGRWLTILRAQWSLNMDYTPHFTVGNMKRSLDVIAGSGEKIVSLWTDAVTAVPAVTTSHPNRVDHVLGGNTSGRVQLWTAT